jgi:hypothetical protein
MANPTTTYGFRYLGLIDGAPPNFGLVARSMGAAYATAVYQGDPAILTSGLLALATVTGNTGAGVCGVFQSFTWPSISAGMTIRDRAWLGNTADIASGGVVTAHIAMHPHAKFQVRATGASNNPITNAMQGNLINFAVGAGPGNNKVSTYSADAATETSSSSTLPFKIYELLQQPETDPTVLNNEITVVFNPASFVLI